MKIRDLQTDHVFEGKGRLVLAPGKSLEHWAPGQSYYEPYIYRSSRDEMDKRWKDFKLATEKRGLKVEDKDMVCTDQWVSVTGDAIKAFVYPETFRNFATTNLGFTYSDGQEVPKITLPKFYGVGVAGLVTVDDSYILLAVRPDGRVDTVPAGFLEQKDLFRENPIAYAFRREGRRNSVEPESVKEKDVLRSDRWRNLSAYLEAEAGMESIREGFEMADTELCIPKRDRIISLSSREPKESKYGELLLCPRNRLMEYTLQNLDHLGERSTAILKRYFGRI